MENECEFSKMDSNGVTTVAFRKFWGTINFIKCYLKHLKCLMCFFNKKFSFIFIKNDFEKEREQDFGNGFKFPTMYFSKIIVLTFKKSWDKKIQLNITKNIGVFREIFQRKNFSSCPKIVF